MLIRQTPDTSMGDCVKFFSDLYYFMCVLYTLTEVKHVSVHKDGNLFQERFHAIYRKVGRAYVFNFDSLFRAMLGAYQSNMFRFCRIYNSTALLLIDCFKLMAVSRLYIILGLDNTYINSRAAQEVRHAWLRTLDGSRPSAPDQPRTELSMATSPG